MDDKEIVDLLKRDESLKDAPRNEWAAIKYKIDQSSPPKGWKIALLACSMAIAIILVRQQNENTNTNVTITDEEIYEYITSDSYFDSADDTYAWIGSTQL
ncbi:MAG: hypothetical protein COW01_04985 [Bdellovibrionales bacterium CG12_big_fil_rev_8_21_14_0_65_38_15]|nr:MAG: hypothetical protein COW79_14265 [Bdellovibrionales bacterium CG22_combo_CG10-13_8_21_14_all_38_13]PIQ56239.1 MAG: hypothetical protein COW01_04985 [Bdellovibrionales bacterium CG12_big_fil_rev_8_21_14_0_65_38_15]PIR30383.1 MAG: hypothetical protein COV38_06430 [Bdellovibrionales bacterium CG11_big_fil_rev_8_21_14_0_20_38_13]